MTPSTVLKASTLALIGGLAVAGCSGDRAASTPAIDQASAAYDRTSSDPRAAQAASHEVESARETLTAAKSAWQQDGDQTTSDHYAYLSAQHSAIAREMVRERASAEKVASLAPQIHDTARVVSLPEVMFGFERSDLNKDGQKVAGELAGWLKEHPSRTVDVVGYTDSRGTAKYNHDLSQRRADSVRQALVANGVEESRITARGMGEASPIASNNTHAGRQQNRRVEVAIEGTPATSAPGYGGTR
jgi:outer membrane protein OmpA-like peptidoglycan-associated protein